MTNDTIFTHVPMCLYCGEQEVAAPFTHDNGDGFCSVECSNSAHADMWESASSSEEPVTAEQDMDGEWDAFLSQYDNDPSPYDGTYSEE